MNLVKERYWAKVREKLVGKKSGKYYQRTKYYRRLYKQTTYSPLIFKQKYNSGLWVEEVLALCCKKESWVRIW